MSTADALKAAFAEVNAPERSTFFEAESAPFYLRDRAKGATELNGQTAFLRHSGLMRLMIASLRQFDTVPRTQPLRILAAPSSIGCEAYMLSGLALDAGLGGNAGFTIDAFDLSAKFTAIARGGAYPAHVISLMEDSWRSLLFPAGRGDERYTRVHDAVRAPVRFLEPCDFTAFKPEHAYDVAMVNNLFQYLTAPQAVDALDAVHATGAKLFIYTPPKNAVIAGIMQDYIANTLPYADIRTSAAWRFTDLAARVPAMHSHYVIMARKPAVA